MALALPNRTLETVLQTGAQSMPQDLLCESHTHVPADLPGLPLPAIQPRPRWRPGDPNPFLRRQHREARLSICGFLSKHEPRIRCVSMIAAVVVLMCFLKVEEEEYAVQTGFGPRRRGPQLAALAAGAHLSVRAEGTKADRSAADSSSDAQRTTPEVQRGRSDRSARALTEEETAEDKYRRMLMYAPHASELPDTVAMQLGATSRAYFLLATMVVAGGIYSRAAACVRLVRRRLLGRSANGGD